MRRLPYGTGDLNEVFTEANLRRHIGGQLQHGLQQALLSDLKLCCVYSHSQPARTGLDVVTCQRPLTLLIQTTVVVESQGVSRNHQTAIQ